MTNLQKNIFSKSPTTHYHCINDFIIDFNSDSISNSRMVFIIDSLYKIICVIVMLLLLFPLFLSSSPIHKQFFLGTHINLKTTFNYKKYIYNHFVFIDERYHWNTFVNNKSKMFSTDLTSGACGINKTLCMGRYISHRTLYGSPCYW